MAATAAVWHGRHDGFRLTGLPLPDLAEGDVLVRTRAVTLCGSDLHTLAGRRETALPTVLGHEVVGEVAATGGPVHALDGTTLVPGTRVTWTIGVSCGRCARCRRGLPQKCATLRKYGHARFTGRLDGGLATHCHLLPGTGIAVVPPDLDDALAAPANCATATVVCAVRRLGVRPDDTVLVTGCGMLGLTAIAYLRATGVTTVLACDTEPDRRARAVAAGAAVAAPASLRPLVLRSTADEGVTVAIDFSGSERAIVATLPLLAVGARLGLVGSVFPTPPIALSPEAVVRRLLAVVGVHNYAAPDLAEAVRFLASTPDRALLSGLVSGRFPLDRLDEAVAEATRGGAPRVLVTPDPP